MKKRRNKEKNSFTSEKIPRNISLLHGFFFQMCNFSDVLPVYWKRKKYFKEI